MSAVCRSCNAPIRWERTRAGKPIPLDPDPVDNGNLCIDANGRVYHQDPPGQGAIDVGIPRYVTHFATCPSAQEHRR